MKRWTDDDIALLRAFYPHSHVHALMKLYSGKHRNKAIIKKASNLGLGKTSAYLTRKYALERTYAELGRSRKTTKGRIQILVNGKWRNLSHLIWERYHGVKVPKGYTIYHKDGDYDKVEIDNLALEHRREILLRNSINNYPPELRQTIKLNNKITRLINE